MNCHSNLGYVLDGTLLSVQQHERIFHLNFVLSQNLNSFYSSY